jgi:hypothetical protein
MAAIAKIIFAAGLSLGSLLALSSQAAAQQRPDLVVASYASPAQFRFAPAPLPASAKFLGHSASNDVLQMAAWVLATDDNQGRPFIIVDKKIAKVFVLEGNGQLLGATPALLGLARGDDSAPGIGDRKLRDIRPEERTTPAGRFVAALGIDLNKQEILWVDYHIALALHRVLSHDSEEHRLERVATASPRDKRITFGCINVPAKFYDGVVHPAFQGTSGIVYILPEIKSIAEVFFAPQGNGSPNSADESGKPGKGR